MREPSNTGTLGDSYVFEELVRHRYRFPDNFDARACNIELRLEAITRAREDETEVAAAAWLRDFETKESDKIIIDFIKKKTWFYAQVNVLREPNTLFIYAGGGCCGFEAEVFYRFKQLVQPDDTNQGMVKFTDLPKGEYRAKNPVLVDWYTGECRTADRRLGLPFADGDGNFGRPEWPMQLEGYQVHRYGWPNAPAEQVNLFTDYWDKCSDQLIAFDRETNKGRYSDSIFRQNRIRLAAEQKEYREEDRREMAWCRENIANEKYFQRQKAKSCAKNRKSVTLLDRVAVDMKPMAAALTLQNICK